MANELPSKPAVQSVSAWASTLTVILGLAVTFGLIPQALADFINANMGALVGGVTAVLGLVNLLGTMKRKTKIQGLM